MKKTAKISGSNNDFRPTGNTTKSDSIDIKKKCLVEKTSFDYGEGGAIAGDSNQTPTGLKVKTKKALGKSLGKIDFSLSNNEDNVFLNAPLEFSLPLKNLVNISVCKSFILDIGLDKVVGKFSQEKLQIVRKLFSKINGFGRVSTPSKFVGIIRVTFTSKLSWVQASKKAEKAKIMVNSDLKKSFGCSDRAVVLMKIPIGTSTKAVHAVLSKFGIIKSIKMQLVGLWQKTVIKFEQVKHADLVTDAVHVARSNMNKELWDACNVYKALLYTLPMGTNVHDIWNYVTSVDEKTCVIDHHPVSYVWARCATVCFDSVESLNAVIETMPVLRGANLHWSCLVSAKCAGCGKLGHTSLACPVGEKKSVPSGASLRKTFLNSDKSRLAAIYAKHSALVARPVQIADGFFFLPLPVQNVLLRAGFSSKMKPTPLVSLELNNRFVTLECSIANFTEHVDMLTMRLSTSEPMVSQLSPECQLLVTSSSQNQEADIVISKSLGVATGGKTVAGVVVFNPTVILRLEKTLNNFLITVMSFLAKIDNVSSDNIIHWHKEKNNLVSIFTESKLKEKVYPWIVNKFDGMQVFISGLESGYLSAGVVVVMNSSLAKHVCKISEMPSQLLSIKLLFKNNLSVSILGLYADISLVAWFSQTSNINSLIAKAVNESSFIIFRDDFNEDSSCKYTSLKKYLDFGLVNVLSGSSCEKSPTWSNFQSVVKTIDYMLISSNLVNVIVGHGVFGIKEYFDTDYQAVLVLVGLGGLLNVHLNSVCKQANKDCCKYNCKGANGIRWAKFKDDMVANAAMLHDNFFAARMHSNLDAIWVAFCKVLCLSVEAVFKKKWFKNYDHVFVKKSSKFHKLELLVLKLKSLDLVNASMVKSFFLKLYHSSKISEVECVKEFRIRSVIDKKMESFELNKSHTIRNVLEHSFCKVTLDHLVMDNELVLEPNLIKTKIRKHNVVSIVPSVWHCQYQPLEYVFDDTFSDVMCPINFDKMSSVISNLPNGKVAGLFGVFMNTCLIALIETACKILSKILSNRIFFVFSKFNVFRRDNFSVLKGMTTQSPIFTIGSVIEDVLEKNRKLWLMALTGVLVSGNVLIWVWSMPWEGVRLGGMQLGPILKGWLRAVAVSVGLGGLLDVNLMSFYKQANKDWWKFNFKDAMTAK
ncbi:hypothetical protein G9A89_022364 [Geosiphon pyriformis]|nr:hypothetical protein G9A89_022364 [Geosiphon pyriformis]